MSFIFLLQFLKPRAGEDALGEIKYINLCIGLKRSSKIVQHLLKLF